MSNQLLVLSFDSMASPKIYVSSLGNEADWARIARCMGVAWYPNDAHSIAVVKDFIMLNEAMRSSTFFAFSNEECGNETPMMDLQPFTKPYAGKDWVWSSNPHVHYRKTGNKHLLNTAFQEVGNSLSESTFGHFLQFLNQHAIYSIDAIAPAVFDQLITEITRLHPASFVVSDGDTLLIYCSQYESDVLYTCSAFHPSYGAEYTKDRLIFAINDPLDIAKSMLAISNSPFSAGTWNPIPANTCLLVRKGQVMSTVTVHATTIAPESPSEIDSSSPIQQEMIPQTKFMHYQEHPLLAHQRKLSKTKKRLHVYHQTLYTYEQDVEFSTHTLRQTPVQDNAQKIIDFNLKISGDTEPLNYEDVFGNRATNFSMYHPYRELKMEVDFTVEINPMLIDFSAPLRQVSIPLFWTPWQRQMMSPYLLPIELPETELRALSDYAMSFVERNRYNLLDTVLNINDTIYRDYQYLPGSTTLHTTPYDVFVQRKGVCQDFAGLFVCIARLLNIPARYRVGYIYTGGNYENKVQSDASHGWIELYLPFIGWIGFDPTNDILANQDHVRVACGRNYRDATPSSGTIYKGGRNEALFVDVKVTEETRFTNSLKTNDCS